MNKEYILKNLSSLTVEEIVDAILKEVISLEDVSEMLGEEKLSRITEMLREEMASRLKAAFRRLANRTEDSVPVLPLPSSSRVRSSSLSRFNNVTFGSVLMDSPRSGMEFMTQRSRVEDKTVYSAVYAPSSAEWDKWFKVPVFLYDESAAERVNQRALEMDGKARLMEAKPLSLKIELGAQVDAEISVYDEGVQVSKTMRSLIWNGDLTSAVFQVKAIDPCLRSIAGDITLSTGGIPLGEYSFNTDIVTASVEKEELELGKAKSFTKAFISYAHADADSAKTVVNLLHGLGYKYFYDRESLAPGDLFEERILKSIEQSDVFFLLWSQNAAQSAFVEKEYRHALPLAYPPKPKTPTLAFKPFFVDHPHAEPPAALQMINFVDLYSKR